MIIMLIFTKQRRFVRVSRQSNCGAMEFLTFVILMMLQMEGIVGETPYHYISQVAETTPRTLSPKPLFSPHDSRREGNGRKRLYPEDNGRGYAYGTSLLGQTSGSSGQTFLGQTGGSSGQNYLFTDTVSNVNEADQAFWYPVYTDIQYPGWISLSETPYSLSYGALPEGYAPRAPLRGNPTGYSFSYQAGDHSRHETSDGRGNFYSSFSSISADNVGQHPLEALPSPDYNVYSTRHPPTVNIPARRPSVYSTVPPTFRTNQPTSQKPPLFIPSQRSRPFDTPTAKPLIGDSQVGPNYNDFNNGYYFESKKLFTTRTPQTPFTASSHALSTNIQYDNLARESSSKSSLQSSRSRSVTIESVGPSTSPRVSTERSYQTLSRSLPLAFASQRLSTVASPYDSHLSEKPLPSQIPRRVSGGRARLEADSLRSASRRSTTENIVYPSFQPSTTPFTPSSSKKPSVIQKIPRKLKLKNITVNTDEFAQRPSYIHDLTSLAYSADKNTPVNKTIMQFNARNSKNHQDSSENTVAHEIYSLGIDNLKNSSRLSDVISKDGYIVGNKTYLGGLGLRTNIHY